MAFYRKMNERENFGYPQFDDLSFRIKFASKNHNSSGLQLADLIARPIGLNVLKPEQENRAYNVIKEKYNGEYGNNIFP